MTGAEHYAKAEELIEALENDLRRARTEGRKVSAELVAATTRVAQVHATLALAQATLVGMEHGDWDAP